MTLTSSSSSLQHGSLATPEPLVLDAQQTFAGYSDNLFGPARISPKRRPHAAEANQKTVSWQFSPDLGIAVVDPVQSAGKPTRLTCRRFHDHRIRPMAPKSTMQAFVITGDHQSVCRGSRAL